MAYGTVKFFHEEKGWGAISCDELPPGQDAFVHFSDIAADGYRMLREGQSVEFQYQPAVQDSFRWIASEVRPAATRSTP